MSNETTIYQPVITYQTSTGSPIRLCASHDANRESPAVIAAQRGRQILASVRHGLHDGFCDACDVNADAT